MGILRNVTNIICWKYFIYLYIPWLKVTVIAICKPKVMKSKIIFCCDINDIISFCLQLMCRTLFEIVIVCLWYRVYSNQMISRKYRKWRIWVVHMSIQMPRRFCGFPRKKHYILFKKNSKINKFHCVSQLLNIMFFYYRFENVHLGWNKSTFEILMLDKLFLFTCLFGMQNTNSKQTQYQTTAIQ